MANDSKETLASCVVQQALRDRRTLLRKLLIGKTVSDRPSAKSSRGAYAKMSRRRAKATAQRAQK